MSFQLVQGVSAENISGVHSAYSVTENGVSAVLSAELIKDFFIKAVSKLEERVFFFLELPCTDEEEKKLRCKKSDPFHCNVYYLDGCTIPVAKAVMKRYGDLLVNDGVAAFGFGSHKSGEEIGKYKYQNVSAYGRSKVFAAVLEELGVPREDGYKTLWDNFSDETPGCCSVVEINGETVFDIPEKLKSEGMYLADTVEE